MNENLPRWIFASICQHFEDTLGSGVTMYVEGYRRRTSDVASFVELRIDGPNLSEPMGNETYIRVGVNILIQQNTETNSVHTYYELLGKVCAACTNIRVYKYGSGVGDDDSLLVCLSRGQGIEVRNYGQLKPEFTVQQGTVDALYKGAI